MAEADARSPDIQPVCVILTKYFMRFLFFKLPKGDWGSKRYGRNLPMAKWRYIPGSEHTASGGKSPGRLFHTK